MLIRRLVAVLLLAAGSRLQAAGSDEDAVRAIFSQETEAWRKYDAKQVSSLYRADAVWQNPFGVRLKGQCSTRNVPVKLFQRPRSRAAMDTSASEPALADPRFAAPTLAVEAGGWKISECMTMDELPHP